MKKNLFLNFSLKYKYFYKLYLYYNLYLRHFKYLIKDSYSQFGEDIFLKKYFSKKKGFYIDIGCHHPYGYNNTFILFIYKHLVTHCILYFIPKQYNFTINKNGTQNKTQKTHKPTTNKCSSKMMMCTHFVNTTFQLPARHPCGTPCFHGWYIRSVRCL